MKDVTLNQREQARLHVLNSVLEYQAPIAQAAELLGVSERHARWMLAGYREQGAAVLSHGNRGRRPHNAISPVLAAAVVELAAQRYEGANHTHFTELLSEREGIDLSRPTVRRILTRVGIGSPRSRRSPQHRFRRQQMPQVGMLVQLDGSHHAWLEDRGPKFVLLLAVDDATGAVVNAVFRTGEDTRGYFMLLEGLIESWGLPPPDRGRYGLKSGCDIAWEGAPPSGILVVRPPDAGDPRCAFPANAIRCKKRLKRIYLTSPSHN